MRPTFFRLQSLGANSAKSSTNMPKDIPFYASKRNLAINALVTSLYGYGLYAFYKDYVITRNTASHKAKTTNAEVPTTYYGRVEEVHDAPNRLFHSEHEDRNLDRSTMRRVFHSLTYGDMSQFTVAWGFLIQLCNTTHSVYGTKSMIFRTSLLGVAAFPPVLYYLYRLRLFNLEAKGVVIN